MHRIVIDAKSRHVARPAWACVALGVAIALLALGGSTWPNETVASDGPIAVAPPAPPLLPRDQPFHGAITLSVTATDTDHQIFTTHETIPVQHPGEAVLPYPQWETGSHAPTASAIELTGLVVRIDGHQTAWHRDPFDSHAFRINAPAGAQTINLDFQFVAPQRAALLRTNMVDVQ